MRGIFRRHVRRHPPGPGGALTFLVVLALFCVPVLSVRAQDENDGAPSDSTSALPDDEISTEPAPPVVSGSSLLGWSFEPKAGVKANVRQYTYYSDLISTATFAGQASANQTYNWSWDQFRKQDKTIENRKATLGYGFGRRLPLTTKIDGSWIWSEDRTINTAGYANLFKVDNKLVNFTASRHKFLAFGLMNSAKLGAKYINQASQNQNQRNNFREATASANLQSGWAVASGVVLAGRLGGTTTGGTRLLAEQTSPSSAFGDSVGVGLYFDRGIGTGFIQMSRSNFERKYLEFRRNANGLIDTVGVPEDQKVVDELETKDALTLAFDHSFRLGRFKGLSKGTHTTDDLDYAVSAAGLKQHSIDSVDLTLSYAAGSDSVVVSYGYGWQWDDQRIRAATSSRGRQYVQERDFKANWYRTLFEATRLTMQYHEGLTQDIAEDQYNEYDKDRMQLDFSGGLERSWSGRFRSTMVFSYRQSQDVSIRSSSSSNNNVKDSYELTPGYSWNLAPWFTLDQNYRVYIQYTDYLFSYLTTVTRKDDYNKRGDLATKITFVPNTRLTVTVRHDFNRRFNATKSTENAAGGSFYSRDLEQDISRIDLDLKYVAAPGVILEAGTYRTRDDKTSIGRTRSTTRTDSGDLVVGCRVDRAAGAHKQIVVSAMIKKVNAFGPSITASSADYWEADVWLKWLF